MCNYQSTSTLLLKAIFSLHLQTVLVTPVLIYIGSFVSFYLRDQASRMLIGECEVKDEHY